MPRTTSMIPSTNSQKTHQARGTQNHASADEGVAVCGFCTSPFGEFNSIPWRVILGTVCTAGQYHFSCDQGKSSELAMAGQGTTSCRATSLLHLRGPSKRGCA